MQNTHRKLIYFAKGKSTENYALTTECPQAEFKRLRLCHFKRQYFPVSICGTQHFLRQNHLAWRGGYVNFNYVMVVFEFIYIESNLIFTRSDFYIWAKMQGSNFIGFGNQFGLVLS
ncbi:MAG: hypothetical protein DI604_25470 [Delftia acidovorans]|nr:MAG: hypothetical protein DI604_25470 [Delftia acidovorans]